MLRHVGRHALMGAAWVFAALGIAGLFLPLIPGVLFLILAAFCAAKSCPALQQRIFALPRVGRDVEAFVRHGTMRASAKRAALFGMTAAGIVVAVVLGPTSTASLFAVAGMGLGAIYVATRPTSGPLEADTAPARQSD